MKILIMRVSSIGDVIHTLPAVFLIKTSLPDAHITWIIQEKAAHLIKGQPFIDRVIIIPNRYWSLRYFFKTLKIIDDLYTTTWDAIIDFQGLLKTSFLYFTLRGTKYGFSWRNAREPLSSLFTHRHTHPSHVNIIQKNLSLASDVITQTTQASSCPSIDILRTTFYLEHATSDHQIVNEWISDNITKKIIALCPNTTWESKKWPLAHWKKLIKKCLQQFQEHQIVLIGKDFGMEAQALANFVHIHRLPVLFLPTWNLAQTTLFLRATSLLIAPDTSFLHLADFLGVAAIGIFGPTSKHRHGPFLYTPNVIHALQIDCPHTYQKTHQGMLCMEKLQPEDVLGHMYQILLPSPSLLFKIEALSVSK